MVTSPARAYWLCFVHQIYQNGEPWSPRHKHTHTTLRKRIKLDNLWAIVCMVPTAPNSTPRVTSSLLSSWSSGRNLESNKKDKCGRVSCWKHPWKLGSTILHICKKPRYVQGCNLGMSSSKNKAKTMRLKIMCIGKIMWDQCEVPSGMVTQDQLHSKLIQWLIRSDQV